MAKTRRALRYTDAARPVIRVIAAGARGILRSLDARGRLRGLVWNNRPILVLANSRDRYRDDTRSNTRLPMYLGRGEVADIAIDVGGCLRIAGSSEHEANLRFIAADGRRPEMRQLRKTQTGSKHATSFMATIAAGAARAEGFA